MVSDNTIKLTAVSKKSRPFKPASTHGLEKKFKKHRRGTSSKFDEIDPVTGKVIVKKVGKKGEKNSSGVAGRQSLKNKLRSETRMLAKIAKSQTTTSETETDKQPQVVSTTKLETLQSELKQKQQNLKERDNATKYHAIKFFERVKFDKLILKIQKLTTLSKSDKKEFTATCNAGLSYIKSFPNELKYVSLFVGDLTGLEKHGSNDSERSTKMEEVRLSNFNTREGLVKIREAGIGSVSEDNEEKSAMKAEKKEKEKKMKKVKLDDAKAKDAVDALDLLDEESKEMVLSKVRSEVLVKVMAEAEADEEEDEDLESSGSESDDSSSSPSSSSDSSDSSDSENEEEEDDAPLPKKAKVGKKAPDQSKAIEKNKLDEEPKTKAERERESARLEADRAGVVDDFLIEIPDDEGVLSKAFGKAAKDEPKLEIGRRGDKSTGFKTQGKKGEFKRKRERN